MRETEVGPPRSSNITTKRRQMGGGGPPATARCRPRQGRQRRRPRRGMNGRVDMGFTQLAPARTVLALAAMTRRTHGAQEPRVVIKC